MDPISAGLGIAGLGMKLLGGIMGSSAANQVHALQSQAYIQNMRQQGLNKQAMLLQSRRQQLDILRNSQRARALALNAATNQGAQFGTGLQGGYGQISGATNNNLLINDQSLSLGQQSASINDKLSSINWQIGESQTDMNNAQGLMSLGQSLLTSGPTIGNIMKSIF